MNSIQAAKLKSACGQVDGQDATNLSTFQPQKEIDRQANRYWIDFNSFCLTENLKKADKQVHQRPTYLQPAIIISSSTHQPLTVARFIKYSPHFRL